MAWNSYRDIMRDLYRTDDIFRKYVDQWSHSTGMSKFMAFENVDVQRKAQTRLVEVGELA